MCSEVVFHSLGLSERCEVSGSGAPGTVGSRATVMVPQLPQAPSLQAESLRLLMGRVRLVWPLQGIPRSGNRPSMGTSQPLGFLSNLEPPSMLYASHEGKNIPS